MYIITTGNIIYCVTTTYGTFTAWCLLSRIIIVRGIVRANVATGSGVFTWRGLVDGSRAGAEAQNYTAHLNARYIILYYYVYAETCPSVLRPRPWALFMFVLLVFLGSATTWNKLDTTAQQLCDYCVTVVVIAKTIYFLLLKKPVHCELCRLK